MFELVSDKIQFRMKYRLFFAILLFAISLPLLPLTAQEQPAAPAADRGILESTLPTAQTMPDYLMEGGPWLMVPLLLLSFIAVLLIIFYLFTIRQGAVVSDRFMNAADALIRKQDYLGLIAVCNRQN